MKSFRVKIVSSIAIACIALTALGQRAWDLFAVPRQVILTAPTDFNAAITAYSNGVVDMLPFTGIGVVTIYAMTNTGAGGGTLTAQLMGSVDNTNWVALTNLAYITTNTAIIFTNTTFGGNPQNITNTDNFLLPGTVVTPNAATAGFATPYLNPAQFTNGTAISVSNGYVEIGFSADAVSRYLRVQWQTGGTITNFSVGATVFAYIQH